MKRHLHILMLSVALATLCASAAEAQTTSPQRVIANIPFAFTAGKTNLPAGKYAISVVNPSSARTVLQIRSAALESRTQTDVRRDRKEARGCDHYRLKNIGPQKLGNSLRAGATDLH